MDELNDKFNELDVLKDKFNDLDELKGMFDKESESFRPGSFRPIFWVGRSGP